MNLNNKIEKAKAKLMLESPYLGAIASLLSLEERLSLSSFSSNGERLYYHPSYLENADSNTLAFMLANGAMHYLLKDQERQHKRHTALWQKAMDYSINAMLLDNGMVVPEDAYYHPRFEKMYTEEIYAILEEEQTSSEEEMNEEESVDKSQPSLEPLLQGKDNESSDVVLEQLLQKYHSLEALPKGLERFIPKLQKPSLSWQEILYRYIDTYSKSTYSFQPPNMKYLYRGIYLPALESNHLHIAIAIDTSGSVDTTLLGVFFNEISSIMEHYLHYTIELIQADCKVQHHETFYAGEPLVYEVKGGGGTDFSPVFDYIERALPTPHLLLYFTDGEGRYPHQAPLYETLWVMPKAKEVPFGEVLLLED
jgi:predicted metal-dependent peptidase